MNIENDCCKILLMDGEQIRRSIVRISHEILERNSGSKKLALVGIRTRGEVLTNRLAKQISDLEGKKISVGVIDVTLYRDDLGYVDGQPLVQGTDLPFNVDHSKIVLVDDVLFTGRTIRAALDAIVDFGRPKVVQLAVLCDRGHRELPIRADYVGKNIPSNRRDFVRVSMSEIDGEDKVYLYRVQR